MKPDKPLTNRRPVKSGERAMCWWSAIRSSGNPWSPSRRRVQFQMGHELAVHDTLAPPVTSTHKLMDAVQVWVRNCRETSDGYGSVRPCACSDDAIARCSTSRRRWRTPA